jgi:hypothetical protein
MRRELMLAIAPELFANVKGSTDSEVLFHLALTFGLEHDPVGALELAVGLVEATAVKHGIENAIQASLGLTDGERMWAFRYSTERKSRTLFVSAEAEAVHALYPEKRAPPALARRGPDRRLRAARGPRGRVARDPRVDGADRAVRTRRAAALPAPLRGGRYQRLAGRLIVERLTR